ncbi:MAG: vitamin K epoxide reductase family protein [Nanoarchaeota archaeon]|nr:vitamin K epoxide reductase family protein [Nanoarchaeota archaeon]
MKKETKYKAIIFLMILAAISSVILSFVSLEEACGGTLTDPTGCTLIQTSEYESMFGMKNAHIGLIIFPILAILTFLELKRPKKYQKTAITLGMAIGSLIAIYFLYLQFFILKVICQYCMVVDIAVLASMALIIFWDEN